jgi:NAD(P)-dependent dehydrogenase (short-subunit alcohol dehydrogenase family)
LRVCAGSVADDETAAVLRDEVGIGRYDAVVLAVSQGWPGRPLAETDYADISTFFGAYLRAHLAAAKAFLPAMSAGSRFIGIGGGMADFVVPGLAPISMMQAAQRMLYRGLHGENKGSGVEIRELIVVSKVNGRSNHAGADPRWLTDLEIGERVCDVIASPDEFAGPVLTLESPRSRRTAG